MPRAGVPLTLLTQGQLDLVETLPADIAVRGRPGDPIKVTAGNGYWFKSQACAKPA